MRSNATLQQCISSANTGLDAVKRAPIVDKDTGIKCIRIQDVSQHKDYDNWGFTDITPENFKKFQLKKDDILIARTGGSIGVNRFIDRDLQAVLNNGLIRVRVDKKKYYPKFVFYLLRTESFKQHINSIAFSTAAQPNMKIRDFLRFEFVDLKLDEQIYIADMLTSIDKKIELNRQTNQTLEQIAQAIFKSWFVDFEPVKAKLAARQAGANPEQIERAAMCAISGKTDAELDQLDPDTLNQLKTTAALFPNTLVDSELGEIPEGWKISNIGDIVHRLKTKKRYKKNQIKPFGLVPVYEQGANILLGYHDEEAGFIVSAEKPLFIFGDHTCILHLSCSDFDISQNVIPLEGKGCATIWVYYAIQGKQEFQEYRRHWSELVIKKVVLAKADIIDIYAKTMTSLYEKKEKGVIQNKGLEQLRDTLLPKLLSGEIDLTEIT